MYIQAHTVMNMIIYTNLNNSDVVIHVLSVFSGFLALVAHPIATHIAFEYFAKTRKVLIILSCKAFSQSRKNWSYAFISFHNLSEKFYSDGKISLI